MRYGVPYKRPISNSARVIADAETVRETVPFISKFCEPNLVIFSVYSMYKFVKFQLEIVLILLQLF